jgi:hypothetical protein
LGKVCAGSLRSIKYTLKEKENKAGLFLLLIVLFTTLCFAVAPAVELIKV